MSIGGFQAIVKIDNYMFRCGFGDRGEPCKSADMKLEGRLVGFTFGKPAEKLPHGKEVRVSLDIEFTEQQGINDWHSEEDKKYVGDIRVSSDEQMVWVSITLPYDIFFQICSAGEREIIFETIHDLITEPTQDQKKDHVVALIKRVYFSESRKDSKTKGWWKRR
jgi:hypothetical protein